MRKLAMMLSGLMLATGLSFAQQPATRTTTQTKKETRSTNGEQHRATPATKVEGQRATPATPAAKLKKDGTPDKRYKENKRLKKDGTPDKRYKENK